MKIQYFSDTDTLAIELTSKPVVSTDAITADQNPSVRCDKLIDRIGDQLY